MNYKGIFNHCKILIAEDNFSCRMLIQELLLTTGAELIFADNGYKAIHLCIKNPAIDAVIMDIILPGMNGLIAAKHIKKYRKNIPVIALSAAVYNQNVHSNYETVYDAFLEKPVSKQHLIDVLIDCLVSN
jgi:CheY-like chemotaxis protein